MVVGVAVPRAELKLALDQARRLRGLGKPTFDKQETFDVGRIVNRPAEAFRFLSWGAGGALSAAIEAVTDSIAEIERAYE
jgi:hypothetical protein